MTKLNEKEWKKFPAFGENGFLHIQTTNSSIDAINLINGKDKNIPYITRSDSNNGLSRFVSDENYVFGSDESGCITVGLDTQTAFYQPHKFVTGQNVQIITGNVIDDDTAHFLVSVLREQMEAKFNWGGNGATLTRMKRLDVLLPVNELGLPDFNYMGDYVRNHRNIMLDKYRNYAKIQIKDLKHIDILSLSEKVWKEFVLEEIFTINSGKRLENRNKIPGNRPFIGATDNGNGITGFVGNDNASKDSNTLGVNYNGAPCIAFYHPYECIFTDDVKHLHMKNYNDNKYVLLFLSAIIKKQKIKYSYGYKFNEQRMKRQKIMLPTNEEGYPDYEYMEQYSKNLMHVKYKQYLDYLEKKSI